MDQSQPLGPLTSSPALLWSQRPLRRAAVSFLLAPGRMNETKIILLSSSIYGQPMHCSRSMIGQSINNYESKIYFRYYSIALLYCIIQTLTCLFECRFIWLFDLLTFMRLCNYDNKKTKYMVCLQGFELIWLVRSCSSLGAVLWLLNKGF